MRSISRDLVVKSVKSSANTYAPELGEKYWVSSAGDTNEYICMNVQQLINAGYFKNDDFEDSSDDSDEIVKSTNILVTRNKSSQVITAVDFKDDGYCSGTLGYDLPGSETATDTAKPMCSWSNVGNVAEGATKTATLTCTDAGSGIATTTLSASNFTVSGVSITSVSSGTAVTNGYRFNVTYKGTTVGTGKYVELKANVVSDKSSNKNDVLRSGYFSVTGNVDNTKPTITYEDLKKNSSGESAVYNLGTYWTRNDRKFKITFNDNEGLASYKITYQKKSATYDFESGQINNSNKTFSKEFTFDEYVYYITVTDKAGNVSDTKTIYASDYIDNDVPDYSKNDVDWVCNSNNRYVSFDIDSYDTKSGISSYKYKVASSYRVVDSGWQSWTSGNLLDCGDNYLQIKIIDKVGNVRIVNVDDYYCSCSDYYDDDDDDDDYYDDGPSVSYCSYEVCVRDNVQAYVDGSSIGFGRSCTSGTVRCGDSVSVTDAVPTCGWNAIKYSVNGSTINSQCGVRSFDVTISRDNTDILLERNSGHSCRTSDFPDNKSC